MNSEPIPWFLVATCIAAGLSLIVMGIPLALRRVPPNHTYGIRFVSTLADASVWYDINARGGRHLVVLGIVYVAVFTIVLKTGQSWSAERRVLGPLVLLMLALVVDTIVLGVAASRLLATRRRESRGAAS